MEINKQVIAKITPKPTKFTLTKIEKVGVDAAEKAMDLYLEGKKYKEIAGYFQDLGYEITLNDVTSFLNKYDGIRKKALDKSHVTRKAVVARREKHQGKCDYILDMAETQLETIKNSTMSETRRASALSVMAKTMLEAIKTSQTMDSESRGKGGTTVNVGIVQKVSEQKSHLRNEVLRADFSSDDANWEDVAEVKDAEVSEEFPVDKDYEEGSNAD